MRTTTTAIIIVGLMAVCLATAHAQAPGGAAEFIAQIDQTLRNANVPLTETQRAQLQSNAADRASMMRILTGEQRTAIRNSMGEGGMPAAPPMVASPGPAAGMRSGSPMMPPGDDAVMSPQGRGMAPQQDGTAAANGRGTGMDTGTGNGEVPAVQAQETRQGGQGGMMGGGNIVDMFSQRLADAGQPLTDEQKEQLGTLTAGPEMMTQMSSILTPEQQEIINQGRGQRGAQGGGVAPGTAAGTRGAAQGGTTPPSEQ